MLRSRLFCAQFLLLVFCLGDSSVMLRAPTVCSFALLYRPPRSHVWPQFVTRCAVDEHLWGFFWQVELSWIFLRMTEYTCGDRIAGCGVNIYSALVHPRSCFPQCSTYVHRRFMRISVAFTSWCSFGPGVVFPSAMLVGVSWYVSVASVCISRG